MSTGSADRSKVVEGSHSVDVTAVDNPRKEDSPVWLISMGVSTGSEVIVELISSVAPPLALTEKGSMEFSATMVMEPSFLSPAHIPSRAERDSATSERLSPALISIVKVLSVPISRLIFPSDPAVHPDGVISEQR